jgi:malate synthase
MEDAATAEISRTQLWHWIRHPKGVLQDGRKVTIELYEQIKAEELERIRREIGEEYYRAGRFEEAVALFDRLVKEDEFIEFLTLPAYELLG